MSNRVCASDGSGRIERLVPRETHYSIVVGTEADSVTLNLSEADFDSLVKLAERLQPRRLTTYRRLTLGVCCDPTPGFLFRIPLSSVLAYVAPEV